MFFNKKKHTPVAFELNESIQDVPKEERLLYALSCPFRSLYTVKNFNEYDKQLFQYGHLNSEQADSLREALKTSFLVTDKKNLVEYLEKFEQLKASCGTAFAYGVSIFLITACADLSFITKEEMIELAEKRVEGITNEYRWWEAFGKSFMKGLVQSKLNNPIDNVAIRLHIRKLMTLPKSP